MELVNPDRWAVPVLAILGGLGLSVWSVYWDYRRRLPPEGSGVPAPETAPRQNTFWGSQRLEMALMMLTLAWLLRYASDRWGGWLAIAGYGAFVAGIALLAVHVGRRLACVPRGSGDG